MKNKPGANYYDVKAIFEAEQAKAQKRPSQAGLEEMFEELKEGDYKWERWKHWVEPRVLPSGDLSLLSKPSEEMRRWMAIDGQKIPANYGNWSFLGPHKNPVGPSFTGIPNGIGRLNFIRFHPIDKNIFLVGSPGGGLWISRDAGLSWSTTTDNIAVLGVADAAVDPKNPNIIYITTGDRDGGDTRSIGVLKSTDGGKAWNTTGLRWSVTQSKEGGRLLIHPENTNILLHAGSDGVYRSTNGGTSFSTTTGISGLIRAMEYKPGDPNTVYAAGRNVFVSRNGGQSWTQVSSPSTLSASRIVLAVSPAAPNNVWAYTNASNLHVSTNSGQSFTNLGKAADVGQSTYNLSVAVSHTDPNYIITGMVQMKRSQNGGQTWSSFQTGAHWDVHGLEFMPGTHNAYAAIDGGLYRSNNEGTWTSLNDGLHISEAYRIGVSRSDPNRICNGYQDNGTTMFIGTKQYRIGGADGFECFFDWNDPNTIWIESQNGGHSRCTWNNTTERASCSSIRSGLTGSGQWNTAWAQDPNTAGTVYTTRSGTLYRSTNRGTNWSALSSIGGSGNITNFAIAPSNSNIIYVVRGSGLHRTANGGSSWTSRSSGISGTISYVNVHPTDPDKVWVSISGYTSGRKAYHSTNGGTSWTAYSEGLPNLPANTIISDGLSSNGVYIGMDVGVYFRNDTFTEWQPYFDGLPNVEVTELEIGGTGNAARLKAATYGRGAWHSPLWGNTVGLEKKKSKSRIVLSDFSFDVISQTHFLQMNFHLSGTDGEKAVILLRNAAGREIFRKKVNSGYIQERIALAKIGTGMFLLSVEGTTIHKRFTVL